jgi:hypothetical protein
MSKNIDEIVNNLLHEPSYDQSEEFIRGVDVCRYYLKQALTEKKLVVPLSEDDIADLIVKTKWKDGNGKVIALDLAKAIYERQFKGDL